MLQIIEGKAPEDSALQITSVLFATPQISVRWERLREDQIRMLRFWLGFVSEHRELLQQSSFEPAHCYANYPVVTVRNENERLTALYGERFLILDKPSQVLYVVNAYGRETVYMGSEQPFTVRWRTLDCMAEKPPVERRRSTVRRSRLRFHLTACLSRRHEQSYENRKGRNQWHLIRNICNLF